jgi:aspartate/methionine/tyrosine aminotransferase
MGYWESPALKSRIAAHYSEWYGVQKSARRIVLTCGASPALVLALNMSFAIPGDRIAFARPGYVAYRNNVEGAAHRTGRAVLRRGRTIPDERQGPGRARSRSPRA